MKDIENRIDKLVEKTHTSKSFYLHAISDYLEDLEDVHMAMESLSDPNRKLFTTKEVLEAFEEDV